MKTKQITPTSLKIAVGAPVTSTQFHPSDEDRLVASSASSLSVIGGIESGKLHIASTRDVDLASGQITQVLWSAFAENEFAVRTSDGHVYIVDAEGGVTHVAVPGFVVAAEFSKSDILDETRLVLGLLDGQIVSYTPGRELQVLPLALAPGTLLVDISVNPATQNIVLAADSAQGLHCVDIQQHVFLYALHDPEVRGAACSIAWSHVRSRVFVSVSRGTFALSDLAHVSAGRVFQWLQDVPYVSAPGAGVPFSVAWSPAEALWAAVAHSDAAAPNVWLYNLGNLGSPTSYTITPAPTALDWHPTQALLALASGDDIYLVQ